MTNHS